MNYDRPLQAAKEQLTGSCYSRSTLSLSSSLLLSLLLSVIIHGRVGIICTSEAEVEVRGQPHDTEEE